MNQNKDILKILHTGNNVPCLPSNLIFLAFFKRHSSSTLVQKKNVIT